MQAEIYNTLYTRDLPAGASDGARPQAGVTLVEMLIVLAVISILVSISIGVATSVQRQGNEQQLKNTFGLLEGALQEYHDFRGVYPEATDPDRYVNSEILYRELYRIPPSRKMLERINDSLIKNGGTGDLKIYDPWSVVVDYRYDPSRDTFPKLISAGPDREFGTSDDISSK